MSQDIVRVLLVEDNSDYAWMLRLVLTQVYPDQFEMDQAENLQEAFQHLNENKYDVLLLDLSLPDSQGYETFVQARKAAPNLPIVVMTAVDDKSLALQAVRNGAQDFLVKGDMDVVQLVRSVQYAVERQRTVSNLKRVSLVDDQTGLLDRAGFLSLGEQHIKIAQRAGRSLLLFYAKLDEPTDTPDLQEMPASDQVLQAVADLMRLTFRSSDLLARIGDHEYSILAIDAPLGSAGIMLNRLHEKINLHNADNPAVQISLRVSIGQLDSQEPTDIHTLLAQAEKVLHEANHSRNNPGPPQAE